MDTKEDIADKRRAFQELLDKAEGENFESDYVYVKCPEISGSEKVKICAMTMEDYRLASVAMDETGCESWVAYLYYSMKFEDGSRILESDGDNECDKRDRGIKYIQSQGLKWFKRYFIHASKVSGLTEDFRAVKK